jgi:hypothetical protein
LSVTVSGMDEWETVLAKADADVIPRARDVVSKGALNVKEDWRERWSGLKHAPSLQYAVTYDTAEEGTRLSAEIGPDKDKRQGALGNLLEFGSVNNAPHPAGSPALDVEQPRFEKAIEDLGLQLLEGK